MVVSAATVLGIVATAAPAGAIPASVAAHKDGVVDHGELGLYYLSGLQGPIFDLYWSDDNFANDVFPGTGITADRNTESYWSRDTFYWRLYTSSGLEFCIPPGAFGDLPLPFRNNVSSARVSSTPC